MERPVPLPPRPARQARVPGSRTAGPEKALLKGLDRHVCPCMAGWCHVCIYTACLDPGRARGQTAARGGGPSPPQPAPRSRAGPAARVSRCGDCRGPAAGTVHARFKGSQARLASRCHPGLTPPATGPPVAYGPSDRLRPSAQIVSAAQPERPPAARRPCRLRASPETAASGPAPGSTPRRRLPLSGAHGALGLAPAACRCWPKAGVWSATRAVACGRHPGRPRGGRRTPSPVVGSWSVRVGMTVAQC